jgi:hypothetical protein
MIEYLAIALLILMVASHIMLQIHCMRFQKSLPMVAMEAEQRTTNISGLLEASAVALEDIADLLEGGATGPPALAPTGAQTNPIQVLLSSLLMSKMGMDGSHGTPQDSIRTIHEIEETDSSEEDN